MVHQEANAVDGGQMTPTGVTDSFYVRKLNKLLVNQGPVLTFDSSSDSFTCGAGTYRISVRAVINLTTTDATVNLGYCLGLYSYTSGTFEVMTGGTEPILSHPMFFGKNGGDAAYVANNIIVTLHGHFRITSGSKKYQIRHKANDSTWQRKSTFCGVSDQCTTNSNVNGAKSKNYYMVVKLGLES